MKIAQSSRAGVRTVCIFLWNFKFHRKCAIKVVRKRPTGHIQHAFFPKRT